jgi:excisionase family DNA binding protein
MESTETTPITPIGSTRSSARKRNQGRGTSPEPGGTRRLVSVATAAAVLGISERAVRKRIAAGRLAAIRDGNRWLVDLPTELVPEPVPRGSSSATFRVPVQRGTTPESLAPLLTELSELRQRNEELAGQVGFWQGRYQEASEQLKLLQAPHESEVSTSPPARPWWRFWRS